MTNNKITLRDLYALSTSMDKKLDKMGERVSVLEIWKATVQGKITLLAGIFSLGFTIMWEYFKSRFKR